MRRLVWILLVCLTALGTHGHRILFIGDSITDGDWAKADGKQSHERNETDLNHVYGHGFMAICAYELKGRYPQRDYTFLNRGISGNGINELTARWQKDVIDEKPDVLSILIGINDVERYLRGSDEAFDVGLWTEKYEKLLDKALEANPDLKIILCTPFTEDTGWRTQTGTYAKRRKAVDLCGVAVRDLARRYHATCLCYDEMFDRLMEKYPEQGVEYWIWDSVHPTPAGHQRMAEMWLKAFKKMKLK